MTKEQHKKIINENKSIRFELVMIFILSSILIIIIAFFSFFLHIYLINKITYDNKNFGINDISTKITSYINTLNSEKLVLSDSDLNKKNNNQPILINFYPLKYYRTDKIQEINPKDEYSVIFGEQPFYNILLKMKDTNKSETFISDNDYVEITDGNFGKLNININYIANDEYSLKSFENSKKLTFSLFMLSLWSLKTTSTADPRQTPIYTESNN